jgi:nucleotide-binding universal stress UspA family protein
MDTPVIVGIDGSATSLAAVRYAAALAGRRSAPLLLVHGFVHPFGYGSLGISPYTPALPDPRLDSRSMLDDAAAIVREEHPCLEIGTMQAAAGGASALIGQSRTAEAVVVGHRGLGGFAELLVGSVGTQVAAYASGPVVIVRPPAADRADAPVVVGIDGSPGCVPALEFAFEEAAQRALPLVAVYVTEETRESADAAEALLAAVVAPWSAKHPEVTVRRQVRPATDAEQAFVDASRGASLVVVGSRGRGGFTGLLLGSVSQALVHHGQCPVAVVHPRRADTERG